MAGMHPAIKGGVLFLLTALAACHALESSGRQRPDIVLILADDLGIGDLGCYNAESKIPTPNMDRVARMGLRFTDMHTPSAVCTPTRYGLLTGRYPWRSRLKRGVLWGKDPLLIEEGRPTIASMLKRAGYRTAGSGKWHLGLQSKKPTDFSKALLPGPLSVGFDHYFGIPASLDIPPYCYIVDDGVEEEPTRVIQASKQARRGGAGYWRKGLCAPSFRHQEVLPRVTDEAIRRLREYAEREEPFFLYVPLPAPHTPWLPSKEHRGTSRAGVYGDFTHMVDAAIGKIDAALTASGRRGNTIFIVTSDNGSHWLPSDIKRYRHRANGSYRGQKADIWDGGHRVPFLIRWPGRVPAGKTSAALACLTDLFRSFARIVGQSPGARAAEDSVDLSHVFLEPERAGSPRKTLIHHAIDGTLALRTQRWKLIPALGSHGFSRPSRRKPLAGGPRGQLYDMRQDSSESKNLWLDRPALVEALLAELRSLKEGPESRVLGTRGAPQSCASTRRMAGFCRLLGRSPLRERLSGPAAQ